MKDIAHVNPGLSDDGKGTCDDCGIDIPTPMVVDALAQGWWIREIGSQFFGSPNYMASDPEVTVCTHPSVPAMRRQVEETVVPIPTPAEDNVVRPPRKTEEEKMASRHSWNAFLAMREATKPEGLSSD